MRSPCQVGRRYQGAPVRTGGAPSIGKARQGDEGRAPRRERAGGRGTGTPRRRLAPTGAREARAGQRGTGDPPGRRPTMQRCKIPACRVEKQGDSLASEHTYGVSSLSRRLRGDFHDCNNGGSVRKRAKSRENPSKQGESRESERTARHLQ